MAEPIHDSVPDGSLDDADGAPDRAREKDSVCAAEPVDPTLESVPLEGSDADLA